MSEIIWLVESKSFLDPRTLSFGDYQHMGLSGKAGLLDLGYIKEGSI